MATAIVWLRRDLRLADNPALQAALDDGYAPLPVYIHAPEEEAPWQPGAASRAWLHHSLRALAGSLSERGSRLVLRRGGSLEVLSRLLAESGAEAVYCNRLYEPAAIARDGQVFAALQRAGARVRAFDGNLLLPPGRVRTAAGTPYRVFGPYWRAASTLLGDLGSWDAPARLPPVASTIASDALEEFGLLPPLRWDQRFWDGGWQPGEQGAQELLQAFVEGAAHGYAQQRELPDRVGSSRLSPHLHFGELSPRRALSAAQAASHPRVPADDQARFATELGWREFAVQTLLDNPASPERDLDPGFRHFDWAQPDPAKLRAWQHGRTGVPLVDAGMRELWATGWMHNRVRMLTASFLTKNLRQHWRIGARWFWDT